MVSRNSVPTKTSGDRASSSIAMSSSTEQRQLNAARAQPPLAAPNQTSNVSIAFLPTNPMEEPRAIPRSNSRFAIRFDASSS
jgi:hypothetical protein